VTGELIRPATQYEVIMNCQLQTASVTARPSPAAMATTWVWGDTNGNGTVEITDVVRIIDGQGGSFPGNARPENVDLMPCEPDGVIDDADVDAGSDALNGSAFPCAPICQAGPGLAEAAELIGCLAGPDVSVASDCTPYDFDGDGNVDLFDVAEFQTAFRRPMAP